MKLTSTTPKIWRGPKILNVGHVIPSRDLYGVAGDLVSILRPRFAYSLYNFHEASGYNEN